MSKYIVHKAVAPEAVKKKLQKPLDFYYRNYMLQPKYDGCCVVVKVQPVEEHFEFKVLTRTGEEVFSMDHIAVELIETQADMIQMHGGLVYVGEAYRKKTPQAEISGDVRRHKAAPSLEFVVFDTIPLEDFNAGHCPLQYIQRAELFVTPHENFTAEVRRATTLLPGAVDPLFFMSQLMADGGYDGIILRDPNGTWTAGDGNTGEIIKIKQELSFDLEIIGVEEGLGKLAGMAGKLVFKWNGRGGDTCKASGGTFEERKRWFENPSEIIGKIGEVECMALTESGLPREPRFKGIRFDKLKSD